MPAKSMIFVSSSSDLAEVRVSLRNELSDWLTRNGLGDVMALYLWEHDTDKGRLLRDRVPVQQQLPDTGNAEVPFTICLFGERCGVPLSDKLPDEWEQRIAPWRNSPGLVHPWPRESSRQQALLDDGCFPLTGTVFELLSALSVGSAEHDNLVLGYVAPRPVEDQTLPNDMFLNNEHYWTMISAGIASGKEREALLRDVYTPQVHALLNLIKCLKHSIGLVQHYSDAGTMKSHVLKRVQEKLRKHYDLPSAVNPFKTTLEHWSLDEQRRLPGRDRLITQIVDAIDRADIEHERLLILIKGRSGCGKSSLLQRGVLAHFHDKAKAVLPVRPTDLDDMSGQKDQLDMLWLLICGAVTGCHDASIESGTRRNRATRMAKRLVGILEIRCARFVLGLDQFEEILDELRTSSEDRKYARGWWRVMDFLREIASSPHVQLIATLESSRQSTFEALQVGDILGLECRYVDADVGAEDVARIAEIGFENAGLRLASPVLEQIKRCWERFEEEHASDGRSASNLPLACLWFSTLFDTYYFRASARPRDKVGAAMASAFEGEQSTLTLADLKTEAIDFSRIVSDLANEAWISVGEPSLQPDALDERNLGDLGRFLHPLIALDRDRHIRLRAIPVLDDLDRTSKRLIKSFRRYRLLVPANRTVTSPNSAPDRVRLVHQAVIDHWPPAKAWFNQREKYLEVQDKVRIDAMQWARRGRRRIRATQEMIQEAAQVLTEHRGNWVRSVDEELEREDAETRAYALHIFSQAKDPGALVESSVHGSQFAHLAAGYHLVDLLDRFSKHDPAWREIRTRSNSRILHSAAWSDGPAVPYLLSRGVPLFTADDEWNPIAAAIQVDARSNYRAMIECVPDVNAPAGPQRRTLLHLAAEYGNLFVLEDLLARRADPRQLDELERSALHWAAEARRVTAFKRLMPISEIAGVTEFDQNALHFAAENDSAKIARAVLDCEDITSEELSRILTQRMKNGRTPLMEAAAMKQPHVLAVLLDACDPRDEAHRLENGFTLLHLAVTHLDYGTTAPSDEEKVRARRTVEMLLADKRIDPNARDRQNKTAFDCADEFDDAREVLRQDSRVPTDYESLTQKMRVADLTSRKKEVALSLLRSAPQALTDEHEGRRGIDILIRDSNVRVIAVALAEGWIDDALLEEELDNIVTLAIEANAASLRGALIDRLATTERRATVLPILLNAALRDNDEAAVASLQARGVVTVRGIDADLASSVFHDLVHAGDAARFAELAARGRFALPRDAWGRRPSDTVSIGNAAKFRTLEDRCFDLSCAYPAEPDSEGNAAAAPVANDPAQWAPGAMSAPLLVLEHDAVRTLEAKERQALVRSVRALEEDRIVLPRNADTARVFALPFNARLELIEISGADWLPNEGRRYVLKKDDELAWLDCTSFPIHSMNEKAPPQMTRDNVLAYLAFFCFFVRGEEGPFLILDRLDNPLIPSTVDLGPVRERFREPVIWGQQADGKWRVSAMVYYSDAIFMADFLVGSDGMIAMQRDVPMFTNLPGRVAAPIGGRY